MNTNMVKLHLSLWKFMLGEILMRSETDLFAVYSGGCRHGTETPGHLKLSARRNAGEGCKFTASPQSRASRPTSTTKPRTNGRYNVESGRILHGSCLDQDASVGKLDVTCASHDIALTESFPGRSSPFRLVNAATAVCNTHDPLSAPAQVLSLTRDDRGGAEYEER